MLTVELIDNHTTSAGRNGDHYRFSASDAGSGDTVTWDFGDGTTGTTTGSESIDHLFEIGGLLPGQPVTITMTVGTEDPVTEEIDMHYLACDYPADEVIITTVPFASNSSLFKNLEPWQPPAADISWFVTKQDGTASAPLDSATQRSGVGINSTISNYAKGGTLHALTDGDYRIRAKVSSGGVDRWMDQPFEVNVTPDIEFINVWTKAEVGENKLIMARASTTDGSDISNDINWEVRNSSNSVVATKIGSSSLAIGTESSISEGSRYSFKVTVTSSGQTVTSIVNNVLITEEEEIVGEMTLNTLFVHPVQKATGRALWNGTWMGLMDDMRPGKRRGYSGAVGGGIVGADDTAPMNVGTGKFELTDERYNSTVAALKGLKEIYQFYDTHVVDTSTGAPGKIGTPPSRSGLSDWSAAAPFKISEFYGVVLHTFYVKVTNDTSTVKYTDDGNGKILIIVNQGTGTSTIECNGSVYSGIMNNNGAVTTGIEGDQAIACKVHATYGTANVTTSEFTVNMGRNNSGVSIKYGGITYTGVNNKAMFFYCGSPMANPNDPAKYGTP
jgi:hypothetical protein